MLQRRVFRDLIIIAGLAFWTLGPYGGCACNNPLGSNPPATSATGGHGSLVDDFEEGYGRTDASVTNYYIDGIFYQKITNGPDPAIRTNFWGAGSEKSVDTLNSAYNTSLVAPGANGSAAALRFNGQYGTTGAAPPYPFVAHRIYLHPDGKNGSVNVLNYGSTGLRLKLRRDPAVVNNLVVKVILKALSDYTGANSTAANAYHYHSYTLTPPGSGAWTTYSTTYATMAWGGSWGPDSIGGTYGGTTLASAACRPGGQLQVMAIQLEPALPGAFPATANFDFNIDDIEFY